MEMEMVTENTKGDYEETRKRQTKLRRGNWSSLTRTMVRPPRLATLFWMTVDEQDARGTRNAETRRAAGTQGESTT